MLQYSLYKLTKHSINIIKIAKAHVPVVMSIAQFIMALVFLQMIAATLLIQVNLFSVQLVIQLEQQFLMLLPEHVLLTAVQMELTGVTMHAETSLISLVLLKLSQLLDLQELAVMAKTVVMQMIQLISMFQEAQDLMAAVAEEINLQLLLLSDVAMILKFIVLI